jgi:hypothetical protein
MTAKPAEEGAPVSMAGSCHYLSSEPNMLDHHYLIYFCRHKS